MARDLEAAAEAGASVGAEPERNSRVPRVVVLGIGNSLLADDGVGVQAIRQLRDEAPPAGVELVDGGTLGFILLEFIETTSALIVVDAAELGAAPGSVRVFEGEAMDRMVDGGRRHSVHEAGLADLLGVARLRGTLPQRRALISVQPQRIDWGDALSPPVARAFPEVCRRTRQLARRWAT